MFNIGPFELIVIFVVALIAVGPKRLPELARNLARTIQEFKRATDDLRSNLDLHINDIDNLTAAETDKSFPAENREGSDKGNDLGRKPREPNDGG